MKINVRSIINAGETAKMHQNPLRSHSKPLKILLECMARSMAKPCKDQAGAT